MSQDQNSSQDKTEKPTAKKLRDLRQKGDVPNSRDLTSTVSMIVAAVASIFMLRPLCARFLSMLERIVLLKPAEVETTQAIAQLTQELLLNGLLSALPLIVLVICASALTGFLQVGGILSFEQVTPKLSRIHPIEGIKRMFALRNLVELIKLMVKALLLFAIVYLLVRQMLPVLFNTRFLPTSGVFVLAGRILSTLVWMAVLGFVFLAFFDVWFQRWDYLRRNRMSKEEVRREHKETEGDPHIRAKRRQLQRELSMQRMLDKVRKANVVVVNPTHIAVALYYNPDETELPVVLAKGEGFVADAIREIAEQERIPILRDIKLARQLQAQVPIDQYIPDELVEPVAAVMRWVRDLRYVEET